MVASVSFPILDLGAAELLTKSVMSSMDKTLKQHGGISVGPQLRLRSDYF